MHNLLIPAGKIMQINVRLVQVLQIEHDLELHANDDRVNAKEDLNSVKDDGLENLFVADDHSIVNLYENNKDCVNAANQAND